MEHTKSLRRDRREGAGGGGGRWPPPQYGHDFMLDTMGSHLRIPQGGLMRSDRGFEEMAWEEGWRTGHGAQVGGDRPVDAGSASRKETVVPWVEEEAEEWLDLGYTESGLEADPTGTTDGLGHVGRESQEQLEGGG